MGSSAGVHTLEISRRPRKTWLQTLQATVFIIVFIFGCFMVNGFQLIVLLPLKLLPFTPVRVLYDEGIRYSKGAFGTLLGTHHPSTSDAELRPRATVIAVQHFAPTSIVVSFEEKGPGRFTEEDIRSVVERDASGRVTALRLPQKSVLIANHQV